MDSHDGSALPVSTLTVRFTHLHLFDEPFGVLHSFVTLGEDLFDVGFDSVTPSPGEWVKGSPEVRYWCKSEGGYRVSWLSLNPTSTSCKLPTWRLRQRCCTFWHGGTSSFPYRGRPSTGNRKGLGADDEINQTDLWTGMVAYHVEPPEGVQEPLGAVLLKGLPVRTQNRKSCQQNTLIPSHPSHCVCTKYEPKQRKR